MCRLFGLSSAPRRTRATFWLLDAPDSLSEQSRHDPDGTGLGYYAADGAPVVHKAPLSAREDRAFAEEARRVESETFLAHIRFASTGGLDTRNTHPFAQEGRLFAHNGVVEGLDRLEAHLGEDRALVGGDTDSERCFALITREIRRHGGDVTAGIESAVGWIAENLPVYALNLILTTPGELWALRYPETHRLYTLRRHAGGHHGSRHLDHSGSEGHLRVHSAHLAESPSVVVASERMDDNPQWRLMDPGELLHVGPDLHATHHVVLPDPPAHRLTLADLRPDAATSQRAA
ncbi:MULTISPECIES: class II glutamine amidotransferase [Streptomyces]|jgi:glutamine amidotransferase|uniref:Class II glutamine amidotransferase n=1 Tax=Streptomyces griseoaurantiacus TaxID=68213 RepID=A0ABZ1UV49_9ACTN|nr:MULTISPECIES: class II glutamine amidotransferase [Streptomyces]MCF0089867.1 putative glutamine amidotransferase YafJ [Streptomyces sp. MH192]MCF0102050.1 putative glutamine amidotransferase YafJ [Streptomyces sp. MH191]MDX3363904.1 class II glutamine amidotransferase [Streptomyces sp. ME02-6978.2a]WTI30466.1 class II glutamine amidotransferase [Streptomyces jietaisiensis]